MMRSRRSKCPRYLAQPVFFVLFSPPRRWETDWWECRVVSPSEFEQTVDIPVHGGVKRARGSVPGQSSTASSRGGPQGLDLRSGFDSTSWSRLSCWSSKNCPRTGFNSASWCRLRQSPQFLVLCFSGDEEDDEEDEDLDEMDVTQSRFPAGLCPELPAGQEWRCMFAR